MICVGNASLGSEMLRFQGLYVEEMASDVTESEKLLADLARLQLMLHFSSSFCAVGVPAI